MRLFALIAILALSACLKDETISSQTKPEEVWLLTRLNDKPFPHSATLTFPEQGRISGRSPCNSYHAKQTAPLPWFEVGPIGQTKRGCPSGLQEDDFFAALRQANLIERVGDTLLLTGDAVSLEFRLE